MTDERWGDDTADLLRQTADYAVDFLASLPDRPVRATATLDQLRDALGFGRDMPDEGAEPDEIVRDLAKAAEPGLLGSAGPRYFGFVIGGALPAAVAADWLATAWDQDAAFYSLSPSAAVAEDVAAGWLLDLLDLPREASVGFTTGCQMANFVGLAAARRSVLLRHGWDVESDGLQGAPRVRLLVGGERHVTIDVALQLLGFGSQAIERVPADDQGRMRVDALADALAGGDTSAPLVVATQAGNVNTGASDDFATIADLVHACRGWLHVDGAFGLWARTSGRLREQVASVERADSWATDMHKWLNVPYDSGFVVVRDTEAHRQAMVLAAAYLATAGGEERDPSAYVPESSRRARGFAIWAALRSLGRRGVAELVERCCDHARYFAQLLGAEPGVEILNEVVLNQVLVRFGDDELTREVVRRVQQEGTCWLGGSVWQGRAVMRISVSNWSTTTTDVEASAAAILRCYREAPAGDD